MGWIDWLIVIVPLAFVMGMGFYSKKYTKGVVDYLQAGRVCGRYVISMGSVANALSILGMIAYVEIHYKTGFALSFWAILAPLYIAMNLFGYVTYRYRETKALSFGQFIEMRYNRPLRIFAAVLRCTAEVIANMIMPALAARFFIYYLDLPHTVTIFGITFSTFIIVVVISLTLAITLICLGGTLCLVVTDAIQGILLYPVMVILVAFVLYKFSWTEEIVPVMADRAPGESFINPYDISKLRDFNLFYLVGFSVFSAFFSAASWIGSGTDGAAKSPHEQKMAGLLGAWRGSLGSLLYTIIAVAILVVLNHTKYADTARAVKTHISTRISEELIVDQTERENFIQKIKAIPPLHHRIGIDKPLSEKENMDTPYLEAAHQEFLAIEKRTPAALKGQKNGNAMFAQFRTLYHQLMLAMTMRHIFPPGLMGLFCIFMILAMLSTDDTRIFSSALTITQDVIAPFCDLKKLTPQKHIWLLRIMSILVGVIFFIGSLCLEQLDYINLFVTMACSLWCAGCGPVMILGLYSRFGTTAGAFTSLISGMVLSLGSIFTMRNWPDLIYPWLNDHGWVEPIGRFLTFVSKPLNPYIVWEMDAVRFPINAYEVNMIIMIFSVIIYCVVSWCTLKEPFNLDRMLHRGIYNTDGENKTRERLTLKSAFRKMLGITPEYTKGDRIIAWAMFIQSFIYGFLLKFIIVMIWNIFWPWPLKWWSYFFLWCFMIWPLINAAVSVFWFGIGGTVDLIRLFKDLEKRVADDLDNGMVEGNVSLSDISKFQKREEEAGKK